MSTTLHDEMEFESYELCIRILEIERYRIVRRGRLTEQEDTRLTEIDREIQIYENLIAKYHREVEKKLIDYMNRESCTQ